MAITLGVATVLAGNSKTAGTSFVSLYATPGIGRVVTVVVASDNGTITTNGASSLHTSVTDNASTPNTYEKLLEYTYGSPGSNAGSTVSVWITKIAINPTQLTVSFGQSLTAKAISGSSWNVDSGNNLRLAGSNTGFSTGTYYLTPSISISGLTSKQYLFMGAYGIEAPNTDTFGSTAGAGSGSPSTGWGFVLAGTTGGSAVSNMCAVGDYVVATQTGCTVAPNMSVQRDWAAIVLALEEYTPAPPPAFQDLTGMLGVIMV